MQPRVRSNEGDELSLAIREFTVISQNVLEWGPAGDFGNRGSPIGHRALRRGQKSR